MTIRDICTFIFCFTIICSGQNDNNNRSALIEGIKQQMLNISLISFFKINSNDTDRILTSIHNKLKISARPLGPKADKYVQFIIHGLYAMANNKTKPLKLKSETRVSNKPILLRKNATHKANPRKSKYELIKEISKKIYKVTEFCLRNAKTEKEAFKIIDKVKNKIIYLEKQQGFDVEKQNRYLDLIIRGMLMAKTNLKNRRMILEFINSVDNNMYSEDEESVDYYYDDKTRHDTENPKNNKYKDLREGYEAPTTEYPVMLPLLIKSCDDISKEICSDMKVLNSFSCMGEHKFIPLNKLCDGSVDCLARTDETRCLTSVLDKIQKTLSFMSRFENYLLRNCHYITNLTQLVKQNRELGEALQKHLHFLNEYKSSHLESDDIKDLGEIKATIQEVTMVINKLAVVLDSAVCSPLRKKSDVNISVRKMMKNIENDMDLPKLKLPYLKNCLCNGMVCKNSSCVETCKYVCWFKYSLGRFSCQAIDELTSVSLDVVCDGKFDCYYEADELGCSGGSGFARFEANSMFMDILKMLMTKSIAKEYSSVNIKLMNLTKLIQQLRHEALESKDVLKIKNIRDDSFLLLMDIYHSVVNEATSIRQLEEVEPFLLSINEKLLTALKYTHTGNNRTTDKDGCFCRGTECALAKCTKGCKRACKVQSRFTEFWCDAYNVSLPIENVCDGISNCPNEHDEDNCNTGFCRKHHLLLLRQEINKARSKFKWNALEDNFDFLMEKVNATLATAEHLERPVPVILRGTIKGILKNLVHTYAEMEEVNKRIKAEVMTDFFNLSQNIINIIKTCGQ